MVEAKAFAFRMPPELKAAAVALTKTHFYEWREDGSATVRGVDLSSINDALIYLMRTGASRAAHLIEHDLNDSRKSVESWQKFVRYFLDNPTVDHLVAEDLPEGSDMRTSIEIDDANNSETGAIPGISRQEAFDEIAWSQKLLLTRMEAKAALLKAARA